MSKCIDINAILRDDPRSCERGAPMGASDWREEKSYDAALHLQKLRLIDGDYGADRPA
jgi:hypothetical protein